MILRGANILFWHPLSCGSLLKVEFPDPCDVKLSGGECVLKASCFFSEGYITTKDGPTQLLLSLLGPWAARVGAEPIAEHGSWKPAEST